MSRSETVITELAIMAAQTAQTAQTKQEVSTRDCRISLHAFEHKAGAKQLYGKS